MKDRIRKANAEYKAKWYGKKEGAFYTFDIMQVMDMCEGDAVKGIMLALESGYALGYRKGRQVKAGSGSRG